MNTQFLQVQDGKIAYDDTGSGPLVVCVPGMGDLRAEYRFLAPQLAAQGFRVASMDVRGHGQSSVGWTDVSVAAIGSDIIDLVRQIDAGPAVVIGNSMAAGAAIWAAAEAPGLISGLALIGPAVHGEVVGGMRALINVLFARPWGAKAWLWYYSTLFPARKPLDWAAYTGQLQQNLAQPGRLEALRHMILASKAASEARLGRVKQPALILMGSKDPDFKNPETEARWVAGQLHGTVQMISGAGHYPQTEMPEITNPLIVSFLKSIQSEAAHGASPR